MGSGDRRGGGGGGGGGRAEGAYSVFQSRLLMTLNKEETRHIQERNSMATLLILGRLKEPV